MRPLNTSRSQAALKANQVGNAVRSVVEQLEQRRLLTAVSAISFDHGATPHAIKVV